MNRGSTPTGKSPTHDVKLKKERKATRQLLSKAKDLLKEVDESFIMTSNTPRLYPTFDRAEVKIGSLIGVGGFGIVFEIKQFQLKVPQEVEVKPMDDVAIHSQNQTGLSVSTSGVFRSTESNDESFAVDVRTASERTAATLNCDESLATETTAVHASTEPELKLLRPLEDTKIRRHDDDTHYEVTSARSLMNRQVRRNGEPRYAIKRLHRELSELERVRGMIDLAIEAKFLSVLDHPNIVKMRGMATGPFLSPNFFIIMDRLCETMTDKMKYWSKLDTLNRRGLFTSAANKAELRRLLTERMTVACDLAAAYCYLHEKKLVYRDIKQENIGFDVRGEVKVLDFGLCKSLSPALKAKDAQGHEIYGYRLTPRTGSVPYMAPEVAECKPYDGKCDVFSFAILLWEILSLKTAYTGYSRREFLERVVRGQERNYVNRVWPTMARVALLEAWDHDPHKRPDMKRVVSLLQADLSSLGNKGQDDDTEHTQERSGGGGFNLMRNLPGRVRELMGAAKRDET